VVPGDWPHGVTCDLATDGTITRIHGQNAPAWHGARLTTSTPREAISRIRGR
jgi:hypothetical protein